jgi:hypothetical protein
MVMCEHKTDGPSAVQCSSIGCQLRASSAPQQVDPVLFGSRTAMILQVLLLQAIPAV